MGGRHGKGTDPLGMRIRAEPKPSRPERELSNRDGLGKSEREPKTTRGSEIKNGYENEHKKKEGGTNRRRWMESERKRKRETKRVRKKRKCVARRQETGRTGRGGRTSVWGNEGRAWAGTTTK